MENSLVCQARVVYLILWVWSFYRVFCQKQIKGLNGNCGHAKDHLPAKAKIDRFRSSVYEKTEATPVKSERLRDLFCVGFLINFSTREVSCRTRPTYIVNLGLQSRKTFEVTKGGRI